MSDAVAPFGDRLAEAFARFGRLCVGIDPHRHLLDEWALPHTAAGAREFGFRIVDAAAESIGIVKPQVAFFERFGAAGYAALEEVIGRARSAGLIVIADAKRGDIGTTMDAYARAWLEPGSPLEADAMTTTAYAGVGSLSGAFELAESTGKGVFVLCATSNPEAGEIQRAGIGGGTTAAAIAARVHDRNLLGPVSASGLGAIGLVLGATQDLAGFGLDRDALAAGHAPPVLAPGFGHQGARFADLRATFGALAEGTVVAVSRSVLAGGPDCLAARIGDSADDLAGALS